MSRCGLYSSGSGYGQVAEFCEHCHKISCSIKCVKYFTIWETVSFSIRNLSHGVILDRKICHNINTGSNKEKYALKQYLLLTRQCLHTESHKEYLHLLHLHRANEGQNLALNENEDHHFTEGTLPRKLFEKYQSRNWRRRLQKHTTAPLCSILRKCWGSDVFIILPRHRTPVYFKTWIQNNARSHKLLTNSWYQHAARRAKSLEPVTCEW